MKILIVDDNVDFCSTIADIVNEFGYNYECIYNPTDAMRYLDKYHQEISIMLLDIEFGISIKLNGLDVLEYAHKRFPSLPVVMISGKGSIETAVKATKLGAINFIEKSLVTKEKIKSILESSVYQNDNNINKDILSFLRQNGIIGKSKAIIELGDKIIKFGRTDLNILITGETGTGKKLVANAIHNISKRSKNELITVDIPNIPRELFQSELFGHLKGSFSGATETKKGLFQRADKGTLFLDEIGDLSPDLQANLLLPIESKIVRKVGSVEAESVDIRIISATDKNLLEGIKNNNFREQLYHRLRECEIIVPPLNERIEDLKDICNYYLKLHNEKYADSKSLAPSCYDYLSELAWKGNIRELSGVLRVILQTNTKDVLEVIDFDKYLQNGNHYKAMEKKKELEINMDSTLKESLANTDKKKIIASLEVNKGNVSKTAAQLGVSRETLHNKIRKYELNIKNFRLKD